MSSTAITIPNTLEAINNGVIPGKFSDDKTEFSFPTLAYIGSRGATHLWTIRVRIIDLDNGEYSEITDRMLDQPAFDLSDHKAEIIVEAQQKGGKIRDIVPTYVSVGKNLGKKNETNALTQAIRNALGLYNKQRKRADITDGDAADDEIAADATADGATADGAAADDDEAAATTTGAKAAAPAASAAANFDEMPPPMLVKKIGDSREATLTPATFAEGVTAQRKLNGVHFVVFPHDGGVKCYSRTGTEYPGQAQVVEEMAGMVASAPALAPGQSGLPPAASRAARDRAILAAYGIEEGGGAPPTPYFAGELYLHGKSLNWISGQARRGDDEGQLQFHIFDVFFPHAKAAGHDMESRHRQAYIDAFFAAADAAGVEHPHVVRVENFPVRSLPELNALAKEFLGQGYEGAIARKDKAGYRYSYSNYHSANLVKIKPIHDAEFKVVDFTQGTRGKDVGAVIWICEVPNPVVRSDKLFNVVPKDMTYEDRYAIFRCLGALVDGPGGKKVTRFARDIKGLPLTVEYAELSAKTGKPLQAKALAFRTYEAGPQADPVKAMLDECLPKK